MRRSLCVLGGGGKVEGVCEVSIVAAGEVDITAVESSVVAKQQLVIEAYTREPIDLTSCLLLSLQPGSSEQTKALEKFRGYLLERKKTAVVRTGDQKLYLLPSASQGGLVGYLTQSSKLLSRPKESAVVTAQQLENLFEGKLQVFLEDADVNSLRLDPMDRPLRFIAHDVVEQFSLRTGVRLVSASEGDDEERQVVVYRSGFEPAVDVTENRKVVVVSGAKKPSVRVTAPAPPNPGTLRTVNQHVRDRRTVEEVQLERQALKRSRGDDNDDYGG